MEGLQSAIHDATNAALYNPIRIGSIDNHRNISLSMYVDDVMFMGEWFTSNATNLLTMLNYFFAVSGLKIDPQKSLLYGVGRGASKLAKFWFDPWVDHMIMAIRFPMALENNKHSLVVDRVFQLGWIWNWRRPTRCGIEQSQFYELISLLSQLSISQDRDSWIWTAVSNNTFSVSSTRRLIDNSNIAPISCPINWVKVVPIKINIFIWRLKLFRLPTWSSLVYLL
ncbi:uncharacterized protein [Rutidosis leptorrhynchoides]|uniref:uncharacterized protein n=1 Tax=Rutidosis leptorrhynchoides TaxID=125765 RepID=UPI003A997214